MPERNSVSSSPSPPSQTSLPTTNSGPKVCEILVKNEAPQMDEIHPEECVDEEGKIPSSESAENFIFPTGSQWESSKSFGDKNGLWQCQLCPPRSRQQIARATANHAPIWDKKRSNFTSEFCSAIFFSV